MITIVSKNRSNGAKFIENDDRNFDIIIMDDGLQNNQLHKDINILLIDKNRFFIIILFPGWSIKRNS